MTHKLSYFVVIFSEIIIRKFIYEKVICSSILELCACFLLGAEEFDLMNDFLKTLKY